MAAPHSPVRSQFSALRWRLLLAFLGVVAATLAVGGLSVYRVVAGSLYQRLDQTLFTLANAAAPALAGSSAQASSAPHRDHDHDDGEAGAAGAESEPSPGELPDSDGDLDLPWQTLRQPRQGIEWFAADGQRLRAVGEVMPQVPLATDLTSQGLQPAPQHRLLTVPVYRTGEGGSSALQGYVRVTADTTPIDNELLRLQQGLLWGALAALSLSGLGSWGLMRLAMTPIEQSFERLRQFTADASHELRSPLTAIQTSMAVMQSHPERLHPADIRKVELTASAARQMGRLVDDLLLLTRLDNAPDRRQQVSVPLDELLEDLADRYSLQLAAGAPPGLSLETKLLANATVEGDGDQLQRLFANLLDNAIQYTPGPGTIRLTCDRQDTSAVVTIADTGIGIAPEHLPHIYDRFWRADTARSHRGGSGLGLAIVQGIVQAHRGSITFTSQPGRGTTVQVRLPLAR